MQKKQETFTATQIYVLKRFAPPLRDQLNNNNIILWAFLINREPRLTP